MTLEKAIQILQSLLTNDPQFPPLDRNQAIHLALEALKFTQRMRRYYTLFIGLSLPGEEQK